MKKISEFIVKYSKFIIISVVIITAVLGFFAAKIKINSDVVSYLSQKEPVVKLFRKCGKIFGSNYLLMTAIENPAGIFNYNTLKKIKFLSDGISEIDGVANVTSLTKIIDIRDINGGIEVNDLISDDILKGNDLIKLKNYVLLKDMYRGSIISADAKSTVILVKISDDVNRTEVARKVKRFIEKNKGLLKTYYTGMPIWIISMNDIILSDLVKLTPFVILIVTLILFISFKSFRSVFLILITVFISAVWTIGLMSLLGVDMTMISDITPIVLIAVGSAYGIHFINKYLEERKKKNRQKNLLIKETVKEVGIPIILAGLTTMAGFFSFLSANLTMTREFGIFTGIGVLFALLLSITFIPAIILNTKIYSKDKNINKAKHISVFHKYMHKLGGSIIKHEKIIIIGFIIIVILSVTMIFRVTREVNMEKYFPDNTIVRKASKYVKNRFGGAIPLQIYIESDNIKTPYVLKQILYTEKFLNSINDVHNPRSISDLICELNKIMTGYYAIPDSREKIENLWFFIDGQESLEQMINYDADKALIQATTTSMDTSDMKRHKKLISNFIKKELILPHIKVDISKYPDKFKELSRIKIERVSKMIYFDLNRKVDFNKIKKIVSKVYVKNTKNIDFIFNNIKKIIPIAEQTGKTIKLIKGDLYELYQPYIYVPINKAKKIGVTGEEYKLTASQTGMGPIYINLDENLLRSQLQSIIMAFVIVFLLIAFQFKSALAGLISSIPIAISILMNFGLMGLLHIPLDIATLMLGGITIGIGIDYTIHFVTRFKNEIISGNNLSESLINTLETTGTGIVINALSVGLGFLILIFSNIIPLRHFGLLTFIIMIISSVSAITILPAIFTVTKVKFITKKN